MQCAVQLQRNAMSAQINFESTQHARSSLLPLCLDYRHLHPTFWVAKGNQHGALLAPRELCFPALPVPLLNQLHCKGCSACPPGVRWWAADVQFAMCKVKALHWCRGVVGSGCERLLSTRCTCNCH